MCLETREILDCATAGQSDLSQVKGYGRGLVLKYEELLRLLKMLDCEPTAKDKNRESLAQRFLELQGHGVYFRALFPVAEWVTLSQ
jgi:hypothetical protein